VNANDSSDSDAFGKIKVPKWEEVITSKEDEDVKVRYCCFDCYDSTWDTPKCCFCFPYEMGIRVLIFSLMC